MQEEVATPAVAGEEEVVVDAVDSAPISLGIRDLDAPKDFVVGPQQLLGLDHAVLQSIDRCREFRYSSKAKADVNRLKYSYSQLLTT